MGLVTAGVGGGVWRVAQSQTRPPEDDSLLRDHVTPCFTNSPVAPPFSAPLEFAPVLLAPAPPAELPISEQRGEHQFIPDPRVPPAAIWGYNGNFPGPTIVAQRGVETRIRFFNNLPLDEDPSGIIIASNSEQDPEDHPFFASTTVVHLHGINTAGQLGQAGNQTFSDDGYPEGIIPGVGALKSPGENRVHRYPNNGTQGTSPDPRIYQRPATMWYHDHSVHITSLHVYRGLAGFYVLKDPVAEENSGLPGTRAVDPGRGIEAGPAGYDVPLVLKDVMIAPEPMEGRPKGTLIYNNCSHMGAFGDVITVNGKQQPFFEVENRKYRFRLLNGSDARQYLLALRVAPNIQDGPNEVFRYIGTDQGLLPTGVPEFTEYFHATPSERHEFVIDFRKYPIGTRLVMVNLLADKFSDRIFPVMAFDVKRPVPVDPSQADNWTLAARTWDHLADVTPAALTRRWRFERGGGYWVINDRIFEATRDDAKPLIDTNEDWVLTNNSGGWGHPVHLHLGRFKIVKIEGRRPNPGEMKGFKDTVWVGPNQTITVRHQFWNFNGRFVFHCHNGSHEDHDMMLQFNVQPNPSVPVEEPAAPPPA